MDEEGKGPGAREQGRAHSEPTVPGPGLLTHQDLQLPVLTRVGGVFTLISPAHAHLAFHHVLDLGAAGAYWSEATTGTLAVASKPPTPGTQVDGEGQTRI